MFDKNNDGEIDRKEFEYAMKYMGHDLDAAVTLSQTHMHSQP